MGTHLPFFAVWLRAVGIEASWIGVISAVPAVTRFTTLPFVTGLAERHHALRGAMILAAFATARRLCPRRQPTCGGPGIPDLCRDLLPVDADAAADRRLRAARRGALWPQLRAAAAVGLGGLRGRRAAVRAPGRRDRGAAPDLGHRRDGRGRRRRESRAAAARQSGRRARPLRKAAAPCCARGAFSPSSCRRR